MADADCIFCKIVSGDIPARKLYEDESVVSFMDVGPLSEGHVLVIPKRHYEFLHDCDADVLSKLGSVLPRIANAVIKATDADGYNVLCNNGKAAGQVVPHLHFHIIPRMKGDGVFTEWPAKQYEDGRADEVFEEIAKNI